MNRTAPTLRRGACLFQALLGLAVIGILLLVGGIVSLATSDVGAAAKNLGAEITGIVEGSTVMEAPGSVEIELPQGGGIVAFQPDGAVGGKRIGPPPIGVTFNVKITGGDGEVLKFEAKQAPRNPGAPFEMLGFFEVEKQGKYTFDVRASDGSDTPAAIMIAATDKASAERMAQSGIALLQGFSGGCVAVCGLFLALGCGIPVLIMRKRSKKPDPLAHV